MRIDRRQIILGLLAACLSESHAQRSSQNPQISRKHLAFVDDEFIFTLELVRPGSIILNFINTGRAQYLLEAQKIQIISGIKSYRPQLLHVDTAISGDPLRVSTMRIHPRSSFGVALRGNMQDISTIDRAVLQHGRERFDLQGLSAQDFEKLAGKIGQLNLLSPDIREDYRVLQIRPIGRRRQVED